MRRLDLKFLILAVIFLSFTVSCLREDEVLDSTIGDDEVATIPDADAETIDNHDATADYTWNSADVIPIILNGNSITVSGTGATVDGSKVTITSAGTYSISGTLNDGQIIVDTA